MRKKFFVCLTLFSMLVPFLSAEAKYVDETGSSSEAYVPSINGSNSIGDPGKYPYFYEQDAAMVRLTVVDKSGNRLTLNVDGKQYTSRSLDYIDYDYPKSGSGRKANFKKYLNADDGTETYISCGSVWQGGEKVPTLCMRKDYSSLSSVSMTSVKAADEKIHNYLKNTLSKRITNRKNGYADNLRVWNKIPGYSSDMQLPKGLGVGGDNDLGKIFKNFRGITEKNDVNKMKMFDSIFQSLMGVSIDEIKTGSDSYCGANKKSLEEAFIIVEPVTFSVVQVPGFTSGGWGSNGADIGRGTDLIMSATEYSIIFVRDKKYGKLDVTYEGKGYQRRSPAMYNVLNGIRITKSDPDFHKNYGFYYKNIDNNLKSDYKKWKAGSDVDKLNESHGKYRVLETIRAIGSGGAYGIGALRFSDSSKLAESLLCADYSLDIACSNCDATTDKSIVIQDVTNWDDIMNSTKISKDVCPNVPSYFVKSGGNVYCREEYHVTYPNADNKISVQLGRYFTVNESQENLDKIDSAIPNFAPIEVERIRECKDINNNNNNLVNYNKNSIDSFRKCPGKIKLSYKEKKYNFNKYLSSKEVSYSSNISNNILIQKTKHAYVLPSDTYRYVRIKDGLSLLEKPSDYNENKIYKDLEVSNLPVSFSTDSNGIKVSFEYDVPDSRCDSNTKIDLAYQDDDYLKCKGGSTANVYNKSDGEDIKKSACYKLYNTTDMSNADYKKCVNDRKGESKVGNCKALNKIDGENNYMCDLGVPVGKPETCTKDTAGKNNFTNMVWDDEGGICCEKGTKYAAKSDKCCDPSLIRDGVCQTISGDCNKNNYKSLGRDWNANENKCCESNYKYSVDTKKCEPPATKKCELSNCLNACCYDENKKAYCGALINGRVICPGKPSVPLDNIYRTIDVTQPFINQSGGIRNTGSNWCSNNSLTGDAKSSCSGSGEQNPLVSSVITSKFMNEDKAMYKVHLNSDSISKIRSYNDKNSYDNFDFECSSKGDECKSNFLRNSNFGIELTGKCSSNNFGVC